MLILTHIVYCLFVLYKWLSHWLWWLSDCVSLHLSASYEHQMLTEPCRWTNYIIDTKPRAVFKVNQGFQCITTKISKHLPAIMKRVLIILIYNYLFKKLKLWKNISLLFTKISNKIVNFQCNNMLCYTLSLSLFLTLLNSSLLSLTHMCMCKGTWITIINSASNSSVF